MTLERAVAASAGPRVGVVMGSESDLPRMKECLAVLADFGVPCEARILSAHRTPAETADYARSAAGRGIGVLIAGAGLAAALPGALAACTTLPVIGVPLQAGALGGQDALYAIAQMPPGVPVATVAIDGVRNAAILAVQILAVADPGLRERLAAYKHQLADKVRHADQALAVSGPLQ
ncbi:MAG: 5-(carboxyamino)imidazole ribonucleotide mutase [Symbiobacteriia bacterium]